MNMLVICLGLHFLLVILTSVVFATWLYRLLGHWTIWYLSITAIRVVQVAIQVFVVLYEAMMLVLTQNLALKIHLARNQLLTTSHDVTLAWAGLGASVRRLLIPRNPPVSTRPVLLIALYLGCLAMLHITIPTTFSVFDDVEVVRTHGKLVSRQSTLGLPIFDKTGDAAVAAGLTQSLDVVPALVALKDHIETPGLSGNVLYDYFDRNEQRKFGPGDAQVNVTVFEVSCGTVPTVWLNTSDYHDSTVRNFAADVTFGPEDWFFKWVPWSHDVIRLPDVKDLTSNNDQDLPVNNFQDFLLYSTLNFSDSQGDVGTTISVADVVDTTFMRASYQFMACHIEMISMKGKVDTQWQVLDSEALFARKNRSTWKPFTPSGAQLGNPWLLPWQKVLNADRADRPLTLSPRGIPADCEKPLNASDCHFTPSEKFVMDDLSFSDDATPSASLRLHVLENSLADMVAAIVWTSIKSGVYKGVFAPAEVSGRGWVPADTSGLVMIELNGLQTALSLVGSCIALLCAFLLTKGSPSRVDIPGILQVMWIVQANPPNPKSGLPDLVQDDGDTMPAEDELRKRGNVKVQLYPDFEKLPPAGHTGRGGTDGEGSHLLDRQLNNNLSGV